MWFHNSEYLDVIGYNCTVRGCTTYEYLPRISVDAALCCCPAVAAAAVLLLAAAVRHRVPDVKKLVVVHRI